MQRYAEAHPRRPELSQHFFRDPVFVQHMVDALPLRTRTVVEIGPGHGIITDALAARGFRVIAIEKDARLFRALRERFIGRTNVECHHADFLRFSLPDGAYSVVSSVPFGITAAVVRRLVDAARPPEDAFLVLQLEAAHKFAGTPSETLFSLLHKPSFELTIIRRFRRSDFAPRPRVATALLHIRRREHMAFPEGGDVDPPLRPDVTRARYERFVRGIFGSERDAGAALRRRFTRRQVLRLARDVGFAPSDRISALTFPQWLALFRFYENVCLGRDPTAWRFHLIASGNETAGLHFRAVTTPAG